MYELDYILSKELEEVRDILFKKYLSYLTKDRSINVTKHRGKLASNATSCFVRNTYKTYSKGSSTQYLSLSRRDYSDDLIVNGTKRDRKISHTYTKHLLDFLVDDGYIELNVGKVVEFGYNYTTCSFGVLKTECTNAIIQDKLKNLYSEVRDKIIMVNDNVLILRDKNKSPRTFRLTDRLRSTRDYLMNYNKFTSGFNVEHEGEGIDVQMYKIYNRHISNGGRSYVNGKIQSMSKIEREELTIDGESTVCFDYCGFEPSLAYTMANEIMEEDPYLIHLNGYDQKVLRDLAKKALIIMLNTSSVKKARLALDAEVKQNFNLEELMKCGDIPSAWIPTHKIIELLEARHQKIKHLLYNDNSGNLQQIGSLLNDFILEVMMQRHGCLTLQVHDAFIVQERFSETLQEVMIEAFERILGFSDNCSISQEF